MDISYVLKNCNYERVGKYILLLGIKLLAHEYILKQTTSEK